MDDSGGGCSQLHTRLSLMEPTCSKMGVKVFMWNEAEAACAVGLIKGLWYNDFGIIVLTRQMRILHMCGDSLLLLSSFALASPPPSAAQLNQEANLLKSISSSFKVFSFEYSASRYIPKILS